jgi:hypothetical protein
MIGWWSAALAAPVDVEVGYHGDFVAHPGVEARLSTPVRVGERGGLRLEAEAGLGWHPERWLTTSLRAGPSVGYLGKNGGHYGVFVHTGVLRGWWTTPVWDVEDGVATRVRGAGDDFGVLAFGADLGHDVDAKRISGWYVRPQAQARFPTFHGVGWDVALAAGVRL